MRTDAFVPRDLLGRETLRDEPQDLDLAVGESEIGARAIQQNATRHSPPQEDAERERDRSADIHGGTSGYGLRRRP